MSKKTLERIGMKKEFQKWIYNIDLRESREFIIGNRVRLVPKRYPASDYKRAQGISPGDIGILKTMIDERYGGWYVDFPNKKDARVWKEDLELVYR